VVLQRISSGFEEENRTGVFGEEEKAARSGKKGNMELCRKKSGQVAVVFDVKSSG
jgi:hypothetical protein